MDWPNEGKREQTSYAYSFIKLDRSSIIDDLLDRHTDTDRLTIGRADGRIIDSYI